MTSNEAPHAPSSDAVTRLVGHIFGPTRIAHVELLSEGLCNFNYRVALDGGDETFVLRIYGRDPNACQKEASLLRLLSGIVPVPELLHVHEDGLCGIGPFIVMRYVEGITFRQLRRTRDRDSIAQAAHSIGETLARLGQHRSAQHGTLSIGPEVVKDFPHAPHAIPELIDSYLASPMLQSRLEERVRQRVHELAWSRTKALARLQDEACLVHGDFNNRNVIVRREQEGRWQVAAILDWEFAVSGSQLFDISSFLQYERRCSPSREPHFSLGYQGAGGKLPEEWWELARVVGLRGQCEILTQPNIPAEIAAEVADLVRATTREVRSH